MPQLAPLSWVFLCFLVFFVILGFLGMSWWSKKRCLVLKSSKSGRSLFNAYFWLW